MGKHTRITGRQGKSESTNEKDKIGRVRQKPRRHYEILDTLYDVC